MESVKICFDNADEVWKFVNTIRKFDGEYDLAAGSYTVDAKSILGILCPGNRKSTGSEAGKSQRGREKTTDSPA